MGFFSSRKAEHTENYIPTLGKDDKSVAHVIRSRFYGKSKGKERDEQPPPTFTTLSASAAQTLSSASHPSSAHVRQPSPLSRNANTSRSAGPSILRAQDDNMPTSSLAGKSVRKISNMGPPPSPSSLRESSASTLRKQSLPSQPLPLPRQPTDNVTVTLAQRLNELAVANSQGLLNDDEYRLLRQNLFERFATTTTVPTEAPVVPVSRPHTHGATSTQEAIPRPLSNFQVDLNRSGSVRSKSSVTSEVANFLRRATSRRTPSGSNDYSDTSSLFSSTSMSSILKRGISKKSSASSVRTATSRAQADTISISSRTGSTPRSDHSPHFPLSSSRSNASIRRLATPPSSFPSRVIGTEMARSSAFNVDVQDEDHLKSTAEIRQEIMAVEAEARRLMDAFNGLEMTTLAKLQRHQGRFPLHETTASSDSVQSPSSDGRSQRRIIIADSDVASLRSANSAGTAASMARSAHSRVRAKVNPGPSLSLNAAGSASLQRKNSSSSVGSQERKMGGRNIPPMPALPLSYGHLGVASVSNVSLARSTNHMSVVPEDEQSSPNADEGKVDNEMDDIQRRREEVNERYAARLEYLRAKLKGAQLHEKLARK